VIVSGRTGEEGFVRSTEIERFGRSKVEKMGGAVKSLGPVHRGHI
jgi:hypothetical protein